MFQKNTKKKKTIGIQVFVRTYSHFKGLVLGSIFYISVIFNICICSSLWGTCVTPARVINVEVKCSHHRHHCYLLTDLRKIVKRLTSAANVMESIVPHCSHLLCILTDLVGYEQRQRISH